MQSKTNQTPILTIQTMAYRQCRIGFKNNNCWEQEKLNDCNAEEYKRTGCARSDHSIIYQRQQTGYMATSGWSRWTDTITEFQSYNRAANAGNGYQHNQTAGKYLDTRYSYGKTEKNEGRVNFYAAMSVGHDKMVNPHHQKIRVKGNSANHEYSSSSDSDSENYSDGDSYSHSDNDSDYEDMLIVQKIAPSLTKRSKTSYPMKYK